MPEHAICSPSSAHRWLICTPSARLELKYPDTQSLSAAEGTFAHGMAELKLRHYLDEVTDKDYEAKFKRLKEDPFYSPALVEYVDEYVNAVVEMYSEAQACDEEAALMLEFKLDFSEYVQDGFGRSDAVIFADGIMSVIDFKYGRNVKVEAKDNPQLRLYALGAYSELSFIYDIDAVNVVIIQPRNGGLSSELIRISDLLAWGESIKPKAQLAYDGLGQPEPGEHCKFCKAAPCCKEFAEYNIQKCQGCKTPEELTAEELVSVLNVADSITGWLNQVKEYALVESRDHGKHWPGMKLVEGRSCSKYKDEAQIAGVLHVAGYDDADIYKPKSLIGITAMKKLLGPKKFSVYLNDYLVKPPGKPTLVPESDKRPEWNSPKEDFEEIPF